MIETLFFPAPDLAEIERLADLALARLPDLFRTRLGDVVVLVEEQADPHTLRALGLDHPMQLAGVFQGLPVGLRGDVPSGTLPNRIRLFRRSILAMWRAHRGESLERVVAHVVVHEVGHHFGLSDAQMHALEDEAD